MPRWAFDRRQLERGTLVELEHTRFPDVASRIAMDHLAESSRYYEALAEMEHKLEEDSSSARVPGARMNPMQPVSRAWMFATVGLGLVVVAQFVWWNRQCPEVLGLGQASR